MDPFASLAEAYEAWYGTPLGAYVIAEEERALKGLLPPGESLLEVGAGTGYWLRRLPYPQKVGVEPSEAMLAVGRRRAPEATWVRAWGEALPFPGESFDVVLLFTTLEFVEDVERVLLGPGASSVRAGPLWWGSSGPLPLGRPLPEAWGKGRPPLGPGPLPRPGGPEGPLGAS